MDKSCDTQLMSPRQVLLLSPGGSPLRAQVVQALSTPQYILADALDLEGALGILGSRKIEVLLFEPEAGEMLTELLISSLEVTIYRALLESTASEHGARMTAMRNASENANDLINAYTLAMNRARQAEITQEILEVVAGADALQ